MTTVAKKVGGPKNLLLIVAGGGAFVYKVSELGVKKGYNAIKLKIISHRAADSRCGKEYVVIADGKDCGGLAFTIGEKYRVLEIDADAILVEKLGDTNNPHFVSGIFLAAISNFRLEEQNL
jgi:hypothetical protein